MEFLRSLESSGARVEATASYSCGRSLRRALRKDLSDLLHLVSHGFSAGPGRATRQAVFLDDGFFTAAELSPRIGRSAASSAPLVIFNTCHCGRMGFSLTRLGSWGTTWCGWAAAHLSALFGRSPTARRWNLLAAFYRQLAEKRPLGEAVHSTTVCAQAVPRGPDLVSLLLFCDRWPGRVDTPETSRPWHRDRTSFRWDRRTRALMLHITESTRNEGPVWP